MIVIKKYSNRRLYDTTRSSYINLDDLATLVRDGKEVRVVDAKTEEDLTRQVLVQVLLEKPGVLEVMPISLFHRMIRHDSADSMHPFVAQQLTVGFELLEAQLQAFETQFGWSPPPSTADAAPQHDPTPPPTEDTVNAQEPSPTPPKVDEELEALRNRLADLEARLGGKD